MKNFLTHWEIEEENRKIGGNVPLIDRKHGGNILFIHRKSGGNVLFIDRELAGLEYDADYACLLKLTKLIKKPSNLIKTEKKKPHCPIFYSLTCFIEPIGRPYFCFAEGLAALTDSFAMDGAKSRKRKVVVSFFG